MPVFNQSRSRFIRLIFLLAFVVIAAQLFNLQVISGKYRRMANENAILKKTVYPPRGLVFDRDKKTIVNNSMTYDLMVTPAQAKGIDTSFLCRLMEIDTAEFRKRVITAIIKNTSQKPYTFEASLTPQKLARMQENMWRFNGFYIQDRPVRTYPFNAGGNIFGYLGEVDSTYLRKHAEEGYVMGDFAGKTGLEASYEKVLMGERGVQYLIKDVDNKIVGPYENGDLDKVAVTGTSLYTSLDIELQKLGEKLLQSKLGAIVAIDPKTGSILAMASGPSFDPNILTGAGRGKALNAMLGDPMGPLKNRGVYGMYSPGSTFKTLQGLVGLQEGVITPASGYPCGGRYNGCGNGKPKCHGAGHAGNLKNAIAVSCNSYFANVFRKIVDQPRYGGVDSGLNVWAKHMGDFGLGKKMGVDLPSEWNGRIPNAAYYNKAKYFGEGNWNSCSIVSLSIGQGEVDATMVQLTNAIAMIANKGWYYTPHIVDSIQGGDKFELLGKYKTKHESLHIPDSMFEAVHDGMQAVMDYGTGRRFKVDGINICGKTGTVENYFKGKKQKDHSFFAAFAPRENPKIAIACIVENGGFGADIAAPVVSLMIEKYLHDTISKKHQPWIDLYSNRKIVPAYIAAEVRRLDSIRNAKDTAYLIRNGYIKRAADELGIDEDINEADINTKTPKPAKDTQNRKPVQGEIALPEKQPEPVPVKEDSTRA